MHVFRTLSEVREHTEQWLAYFNQETPHDSPDGLTPAEFRFKKEPAISDLVWYRTTDSE
jgi:putative transposase